MSQYTESAHLWLAHVAQLWKTSSHSQAQAAGVRDRFAIERLATEFMDHCARACGARCLIRPNPIELIYHDISFYVRHDNANQVLAEMGNAVLELDHDLSFFNSNKETSEP